MLSILYQDRALLVCLKPPGLLSQDGPGGSLPERLRQQAGGEIYPVHRLDREAGGVMVYARTRAAAASLSAAIQAGELQGAVSTNPWFQVGSWKRSICASSTAGPRSRRGRTGTFCSMTGGGTRASWSAASGAA